MDNIDRLLAFGLTRQEATLYLTLYVNGDLSGYEAAKLTGISRSNAYNALAGLVEKGAAYVMEGAVTKYTPVAVEEFCSNKLRNLNMFKDLLIQGMPDQKNEQEGYITITGEKHIFDKMKNLLYEADQRIYLSISKDLLPVIRNDLIEISKRNIKIVLITDLNERIPGMRCYYSDKSDGQIRMIVDSKNVLTGEIKGDSASCLYSSKKNLVDVFKEALRNEMKLIELTKGDIRQ